MSYKLELSQAALRDLKGIDDDLKIDLLVKVDSLRENQVPKGATKLRGFKLPTYRVRHRQFRITYRVEKGRLVVLILSVGDRKEVYKRLKRVV